MMKAVKCPNCGANISLDEQETSICEFCGTPFVAEKEITPTTNTVQTINNYYSLPNNLPNMRLPKTKRPVLNVGLAIFLCLLFFWLGIIYIVSVKSRQKEWDDKYTY